MIILIDAEKIFNNIQHTFMIKALKILGRGRNYHHIIKSIYENPTVNIKFSGERLKDVFIAILR